MMVTVNRIGNRLAKSSKKIIDRVSLITENFLLKDKQLFHMNQFLWNRLENLLKFLLKLTLSFVVIHLFEKDTLFSISHSDSNKLMLPKRNCIELPFLLGNANKTRIEHRHNRIHSALWHKFFLLTLYCIRDLFHNLYIRSSFCLISQFPFRVFHVRVNRTSFYLFHWFSLILSAFFCHF